MPYDFFFSYARANNDDYLRKFFEDLNDAVRQQAGYPVGRLCGFFDQRDLERGADWDPNLSAALQESRTFVGLYSPAYFKSEYCGREWATFEARRRQVAAGAGPPLIKPVLWIPLRRPVPPGVGHVQYTRGDPHGPPNVEGLLFMRKQFQKYEVAYNDYVNDLATEILDASDKHAVPALPAWPALKDVTSAFEDAVAAAPSDTPTKIVKFVFVAGAPTDFAGRQRQVDPYGPEGRWWRPYFPQTTRPIGPWAINLVSDPGLEFFADELPFRDSLPQDVRSAEAERALVIVFVDSWTAQVPRFERVLRQFDRENYFNCSVLVPWNLQDPETAANRAALEEAVKGCLHFRAGGQNSLYYRGGIGSEAQFAEHLKDVLVRLKAEVETKAPVRLPMAGAEKSPIVTATPAGG